MALKKTYENQSGEILNGYYRVREIHTQYEKDKDGPVTLAAIFTVEAYDYETGKPAIWTSSKTNPTWTAQECGKTLRRRQRRVQKAPRRPKKTSQENQRLF